VFDPARLPELKTLVLEATRSDKSLLDEVMREVALLQPVTTIQPRNINSLSLVASDGGNNRLEFNPFSLQLVRVVDTFGDELFLDVISPSTDIAALGRRHLDDPGSPLGRLMRDLGTTTLSELSPMIPERPEPRKYGRWPLVYRDLCEWAVLYDLACHEPWRNDTLIIRDGLLRTIIFADDLLIRLYGLIKTAIGKHKRDIFLVGVAKHSRIIERYRLAMAVADVFPAGQPCYAPVPPELQVKVYDWPDYVQGPENAGKPRYNIGAMYLVRFGGRPADPVWTTDLLPFQAARAGQIFGSLLNDAELGFPVPCYPHCLQEADRYAQVVDLDLAILQNALQDAVREQIREDRRHVFDAQRLWPADPAAGRYR
jgi:hypothetical protein